MSIDKIELENVELAVIETFQEVSNMQDITPEDYLNDIGDSLDRVEAFMELEKEYTIAILDEVAESWETVQDVIDGVEKLRAESPLTVSPNKSEPKDAKSKLESISEKAIEVIQEISGIQGIKLGDSLSKLKIDPWDRVEIAMVLEQKIAIIAGTPKKVVEKWTKEAIEEWKKIEDIADGFKRRLEMVLLD